MASIKAIALDVDGVLTDGTFWWGFDGSELKRFSYRDVMGIARATRQGILFALISGEANPLIDRYAEKLHIQHVEQGCKDKEAALRCFADKAQIDLADICFMGDDVNDLGALKIAGFSAAPADAHESVRSIVQFISQYPGGQGAVREVLDRLVFQK
ncbi:MAG: HAD hydrolase family protein [Verrucomicrobiota bacterium]